MPGFFENLMQPDIFDLWYQNLPEDQKFVKREATPSFMNQYGVTDSPEYDYGGAQMAEDRPDERGHWNSIGLGGRVLKSPEHPSFWKTALAEILISQGIPESLWPDMGKITRQQAADYLTQVTQKWRSHPAQR